MKTKIFHVALTLWLVYDFLSLCKHIEWFQFLMGDFLHSQQERIEWVCAFQHALMLIFVICLYVFISKSSQFFRSRSLRRAFISLSRRCTLFLRQTINLIKTMPEGRAGTYTWSKSSQQNNTKYNRRKKQPNSTSRMHQKQAHHKLETKHFLSTLALLLFELRSICALTILLCIWLLRLCFFSVLLSPDLIAIAHRIGVRVSLFFRSFYFRT